MYKSFFDEILLFKAGRIAGSIFTKERENREKQKGSIRASEIPDEYGDKGSNEDIKALEQAFRDHDKSSGKNGKNVWNSFSVYLIILKTFKRFYGIYFLLFTWGWLMITNHC